MANNCKQCSIRIISHTTTPLPKAYDCVAVYIAGRRTSLVVYGWWPQPPTKNTLVTGLLYDTQRWNIITRNRDGDISNPQKYWIDELLLCIFGVCRRKIDNSN